LRRPCLCDGRETELNAVIKDLNRRLGDSLGFVGLDPRYKWVWSVDADYFLRETPASDFERKVWADRIGKAWLIAGWQSATAFDASSGQIIRLTEAHWWQMFKGLASYPARGRYHAYPETAIPGERFPSEELTANYIWQIRRQEDTPYNQAVIAAKDEVAEDRAAFDAYWTEYTQSFAPAFDNWDSGNRGGSVSFGGS
jgi:hypothetical protein